MLECGWVLEAPWKWKHEVLNFRVSLDRTAAQGNGERELHFLREAWRWSLFRTFMTEDRRDSAMFRAAFFKYDARRLDRVRKAIASFQHFQVLSGATMSRAALLRQRGDDAGCCSCGVGPATIDHLAWACSMRSAGRPTWKGDVAQARFGWPSGHAQDDAILSWLIAVRKGILDARYSQVSLALRPAQG